MVFSFLISLKISLSSKSSGVERKELDSCNIAKKINVSEETHIQSLTHLKIGSPSIERFKRNKKLYSSPGK